MKQLNKLERKELRNLKKRRVNRNLSYYEAEKLKSLEMKQIGAEK